MGHDASGTSAAVIQLVGRRLLATIPTLFGVLVVAFLLLNVVPGDPVAEMVGEITLARAMSDESKASRLLERSREQLKRRLGLVSRN